MIAQMDNFCMKVIYVKAPSHHHLNAICLQFGEKKTCRAKAISKCLLQREVLLQILLKLIAIGEI